MLSQVKHSQLPSYKIGWEEGIEYGEQEGLRKGRQVGLQEGRQVGRQEGLQEGEVQGERSVLNHLIVKRFGEIPSTIKDKINNATSPQIEQWVDRVIEAKSLEDLI